LPLIGSRRVLDAVRDGNLHEAIEVSQSDAKQFRKERSAFLLYG
jgi:hypothetical protein